MNLINKFLKTASRIEEREIKAVIFSFLFVVVLMSAYYILRPVRDAMASDWTDAEVSWLWTINFFISTAIVALYGLMVSKFRFRLLVPVMYGIFAGSFVIFYFLASISDDRTIIDKAFYVWVSVFSLFHISVFWSFMSELFSKEQSGRLFGIIAVGASVGGLIGPSITAFFSVSLGTDNLMLIASMMLLIPIPIIFYLQTLKVTDLNNEELDPTTPNQSIGGSPFAGFKMFFSNPYLLSIGLFIFLYTGISSFVYFELKNLLSDLSRSERSVIWAQMDLAVNILAISAGLFATSRIVTRFGMPLTIALVPVMICIGLLVLAISPFLGVVVMLQIIRRAGNYAVTRPAREMLFTLVDQETRFKAKPVIDIVAYRGGDMLMAWLFTGLTQGLGLGLAAVAAFGAGMAALWSLVGIYLGRWFERDNTEPKDYVTSKNSTE
ncbi:MFS transporter [Gammaproteobacteria bacterium]|jgi:AAA family ATP:ADP antiporter|nr:MFS transporter [Gammaproteobacteria bacterium]MDB9747268.1 MFS transporter [Gammaproteobacteria bacterium]MDC1535469.1 MFS transporter [Gammaproteobacteria bacterium]|tara:strand:- start:1600 stop:2910 length:1311 start_codon:yes stop_codon:yes gene_type:complete